MSTCQIGPFKANCIADEEGCIYVQVFHEWAPNPIDVITTNLCIEDGGWDVVPVNFARDQLRSWLLAGNQNIINDLMRAGVKPS